MAGARKPMSCRPSSPIRNFTIATAPVSKKSPPTSAKPSASWPPPRSNGWSSKSDQLQAKLSDPQFYNRDRAGFEKVTTDLGETQRKLAAAEEQWLELEILREELAGS